jgi:hypothetical protein
MSTVKKTIKKAQNGSYVTTKKGLVGRTYGKYGPYESIDTTGYSKGKKEFDLNSSLPGFKKTTTKIKREDVPAKIKQFKKGATRNVNLKSGGMIKRKDGSVSQRGLWDNLRSKATQNKKTGAKPKAPTKAMLKQERKIKSKSKK